MYSNVKKTEGFWNSFTERTSNPNQDEKSRTSHSHVFTFLKNNKSYFRLSSIDNDKKDTRLNYKYEHSQLMFQSDCYNCGVFICLFVDAYLRNIHSIKEVLINENSLLFSRHTILRTILNDQVKEHIKRFNIGIEGHLHNLTHNKYGICSSGDLKGDELIRIRN